MGIFTMDASACEVTACEWDTDQMVLNPIPRMKSTARTS